MTQDNEGTTEVWYRQVIPIEVIKDGKEGAFIAAMKECAQRFVQGIHNIHVKCKHCECEMITSNEHKKIVGCPKCRKSLYV